MTQMYHLTVLEMGHIILVSFHLGQNQGGGVVSPSLYRTLPVSCFLASPVIAKPAWADRDPIPSTLILTLTLSHFKDYVIVLESSGGREFSPCGVCVCVFMFVCVHVCECRCMCRDQTVTSDIVPYLPPYLEQSLCGRELTRLASLRASRASVFVSISSKELWNDGYVLPCLPSAGSENPNWSPHAGMACISLTSQLPGPLQCDWTKMLALEIRMWTFLELFLCLPHVLNN